jgi:hypothetical protein
MATLDRLYRALIEIYGVDAVHEAIIAEAARRLGVELQRQAARSSATPTDRKLEALVRKANRFGRGVWLYGTVTNERTRKTR